MDHPYVDSSRADTTVLGADRPLAERAAEESMTLLRNSKNLLPLRGKHRILLTGSGAASVANLMGGWTIGWQGIPSGSSPPATTIAEGIKTYAPRSARVSYVSPRNITQLARSAKRADVAIVVVSEHPYAEGQGDTETAAIPPVDASALNAIRLTGVPTVVVVVAGRPLILDKSALAADAILMAWLPGTAGGTAIARTLFGLNNPGGRLPLSWPRNIGQEPLVYEHYPGTESSTNREYDPLFPFGFGLSYTTFRYSSLVATSSASAHGTVIISVAVSNTGRRAGDAVVQAYTHADSVPVLETAEHLVSFERVHLQPGQSHTVHMTVPVTALSVIPGDIVGTSPARVVPGHYTVTVSGLTAGFDVSATP
jgi:beta-glucosidase